MNYKTIKDLNETIIKSLPLIPRDVDLIVGTPRSGLMTATLLALYLNLPLTDVEGLIEEKIKILQSLLIANIKRTPLVCFYNIFKGLKKQKTS